MHPKHPLSAIFKESWNHHQCLRQKKRSRCSLARLFLLIDQQSPPLLHTHARCFAEGRTSKTLLATGLSPDCFWYEHLPALLTSVLCRIPRKAPITSNPSEQKKPLCLRSRAFFFASALLSRLLTLAFFWSPGTLEFSNSGFLEFRNSGFLDICFSVFFD